ncbi:MAG: JAB domain-containing protein [Candidatus Coproplasma sp.]
MEKDFRKNCIARFENGYMYDREVLGILLSNAFSGLDTEALVSELLYVFPSVSAVLSADLAALMVVQGVNRQIAEYIVALGKVQRFSVQPLTCIGGSEQLIEYGIARCRGADCEEAELYCVNRSGRVVARYCYKSNHMKKVELNFRTVVADVSASGASGFYLLHNHVYGSVRPSEKDDVFTARLLSAFSEGGIQFLDHCIVGEREGFSYRKSGRFTLLKEQMTKKK